MHGEESGTETELQSLLVCKDGVASGQGAGGLVGQLLEMAVSGQTFPDLPFQIVHFVEVNIDSSKFKAASCSLCIWKVMFCSKT